MTVLLTAAASTAFGVEQIEFYLTLICRARFQPDAGLSYLLKTGRIFCFGGNATAVIKRCSGSLTLDRFLENRYASQEPCLHHLALVIYTLNLTLAYFIFMKIW